MEIDLLGIDLNQNLVARVAPTSLANLVARVALTSLANRAARADLVLQEKNLHLDPEAPVGMAMTEKVREAVQSIIAVAPSDERRVMKIVLVAQVVGGAAAGKANQVVHALDLAVR